MFGPERVCLALALPSLVLLCSLGCVDIQDSNNSGAATLSAGSPTTETSGSSEASSGATNGMSEGDEDPAETETEEGGFKFDMQPLPDGDGLGCTPPEHLPCDGDDADPGHALGVNCPGETQLAVEYNGHPDSILVHSGQVGTHEPATYPVLEGEKLVVLSNGVAADLLDPNAQASTSTAFDGPILDLPMPLVVDPVDPNGAVTCAEDPTLIGTGDCSNSIVEGWANNFGAWNYVELRLQGQVPGGVDGLAYDFAFFSTEYPNFYFPGGFGNYNDMYVAWLESEAWTGNISFDEQGAMISVHTSLFDYKDAPNDFDCPEPCSAPELSGTALEGHGATKWLTTNTSVAPGETFELVFAIMDMKDPILDSMVILDNFRWTCEGGPPVTIPQ